MKVAGIKSRLTAISKTIAKEEALGSSIDVYKFNKEGGRSFYKHCLNYIKNRNEVSLWSEVALNDTLSEVAFSACPLDGRWMEIDNYEDLQEAELLFAEGKLC